MIPWADWVTVAVAVRRPSSDTVSSNAIGRLRVRGDLELAGASSPIEFALSVSDDGRVNATATVTQTAHGIKPYSALFGTLKVSDDVEVSIDARIGAPS